MSHHRGNGRGKSGLHALGMKVEVADPKRSPSTDWPSLFSIVWHHRELTTVIKGGLIEPLDRQALAKSLSTIRKRMDGGERLPVWAFAALAGFMRMMAERARCRKLVLPALMLQEIARYATTEDWPRLQRVTWAPVEGLSEQDLESQRIKDSKVRPYRAALSHVRVRTERRRVTTSSPQSGI